MKKISSFGLLFGLMIASFNAAAQNSSEALLQAIASCDNPNNPLLNGLYAVQGNTFGETTVSYIGLKDGLTDVTEITTYAVSNPRIGNSSNGAPVRTLAEIKIVIGRMPLNVGDTQVCELSIKKQ